MSELRAARLDAYASILKEYMDRGGEASLKRAYEMANEAMVSGLGVLEMAALHHEAMVKVMHGSFKTEAASKLVRAAETFQIESLSPFEMTHRASLESNAALRLLNDRLEEEAKRISHALHAEASQLLVSAHLTLESVSLDLPSDVRQHLSKFQSLLDQISAQIRRLSHELRPTILDDLGLLPALRFLAEGVASRSRIPVTVRGEMESRPPPAVETAIYRAVQEALNNMMRHAHATEAVVVVQKHLGKIICSVRDDGAGFDQAGVFGGSGPRAIGLMGIRERLHALRGTLQINSAPGRGTELIITVPMEAVSDASSHNPC